MIYVIERIKTKSGETHEWEGRRKGNRVKIEQLVIGMPFICAYVDESDAYLRTSDVEAYSCDSDGNPADFLVVQTSNTVYALRKEVAA